jgi:hypothetical protein
VWKYRYFLRKDWKKDSLSVFKIRVPEGTRKRGQKPKCIIKISD